MAESTQLDPITELEQNYPGVMFKNLSELREGVKKAELQRNGKQRMFRCLVKVWGWQFEQAMVHEDRDKEDRVNYQSVKRAVAEEALNFLKGCIPTIIDSHMYDFDPNASPNKIEKMVEEKYKDVSDERKTEKKKADAMRKVLAGIVLEREDIGTMSVVALGTGTKCISSQNMVRGMTVNDCHGEVIVKRAFQRYLFEQLSLCFENRKNESIFKYECSSRKFIIKAGISFHMYVSIAPCGDATAPGEQPDDHSGRANRGKARCKIEGGEGSVLAENHQHDDRMVIMSCSDKMAKWNVTGVQGSLLSQCIKPIFFKSIVVGKKYNPEHMARAMYVRIGAVTKKNGFPNSYKASSVPLFVKANHSSYEQAERSPRSSLNWWEGEKAEVIDGSTGKTQDGSSSRLCKNKMLKKWDESYAVRGSAREYWDAKKMVRSHYETHLGPWNSVKKTK